MDRRRLRSRAFMLKFGYAIRQEIGMPAEQQIRERAALLLEETLEVLREMFPYLPTYVPSNTLLEHIQTGEIRVAIDKLAHELGDLSTVVDGTFEAFGVDSSRVLGEIHRANMKKVPGGWKPAKPEGWKPPDVGAALLAPDTHLECWVVEMINGRKQDHDWVPTWQEARTLCDALESENPRRLLLVEIRRCTCVACQQKECE